MDEIFDRIKAIKIRRKYLITSLICAELLGIIVLVWFLRVPLSQKFLVSPSKAYSISSFEGGKQYLITQGDFLTGQTSPSSEIKILVNPGSLQTSAMTNNDGSWSYQIPEDLPVNTYTVTIINIDTHSQIHSQSYKFRVQSKLNFNKLLNL